MSFVLFSSSNGSSVLNLAVRKRDKIQSVNKGLSCAMIDSTDVSRKDFPVNHYLIISLLSFLILFVKLIDFVRQKWQVNRHNVHKVIDLVWRGEREIERDRGKCIGVSGEE